MSRILIIEDEAIIRMELRRLLKDVGYMPSVAGSVEEAETLGLQSFDLIICDVRLPGVQGTDLLDRTGDTPILLMTSFATIRSAVDAMKRGAVDYISKPFEPDEMLLTVERVLADRRLKRRTEALQSDVNRTWGVDGIVGRSQAMQDVLNRLERVAPTDSTVLILGESGTGKELIARAIHTKSKRADSAFVAVNCASIPEGLIESELFGHEKGAFTGADRKNPGLVETAHSGTLFLDEVGELPLPAQARLLRVLQESEIRHVGSTKTLKVDVRIIAATHRDLPELVRLGEFREDLFFRLRVLDIKIPPLRERAEDLPALVQHLLERACAKVGRGSLALSEAAMSAVRAHDWPGNVRELENAVERGAILADTGLIGPEQLGIEPAETSDIEEQESISLDLSLEDYFKQFVLEHQATMSETDLAKKLGISRKALWERRHKLGIPRPKGRK